MAASTSKDLNVTGAYRTIDPEIEEFQDAEEDPNRPETMDFKTSMEQAEMAIHLFFNNKFQEAKDLMTPWASTSMYHAVGDCVFAFLSAMLTFEQSQITIASKKIKEHLSLCNSNRKHYTLSENIIGILGRKDFALYNEEQTHAELCYSELLLLQSVLTFIEDEDLAGLIKGSLKIKSCFSGYKVCEQILISRTWNDFISKAHFETGVYMGVGAFNLMISLLPARIIKLLEFVGFSGNKEVGLNSLLEGLKSNGMRQCLCAMTLLGYHLFACHFLGSTGDLEFCEDIIQKQLNDYPNGAWFLFFKARLEFMKGNLVDAEVWYKKSIASQNIWPQFHHMCYWELLWINGLQQKWREGVLYSTKLLDSSVWSRTIYSYQKAAMYLEMREELTHSEIKMCQDLISKAPSYKHRIAGKSLPMEKFVIKRCARYKAQDGHLLLPAIEVMYLWNMFEIFSTNFSLGDGILQKIERTMRIMSDYPNNSWQNGYEADNKALLLFLRGACLRTLGSPRGAEPFLQDVLLLKNELKEDTFLIPFAVMELGLCYQAMGDYRRAIATLNDANKKYSGYSLESRLNFRVHAALMTLRNLEATAAVEDEEN